MGIPAYLLTRGTLGNTGAMFLMLGIMLPAFLLEMYEKDGLPFAGSGAGKEDVIEKRKEEKRSRRQG